MIRPRLRPTISRRMKYVGLFPAAERKLGREARRGSHDLRRLVGHANFLDDLADNLGVDDEDSAKKRSPSPAPDSNRGREEFEELDESDSSSDEECDSDDWSDESDDDDHALVRTGSGQQIAITRNQSTDTANAGDYFSRSTHGEVKLNVEEVPEINVVVVGEKEVVAVISTQIELTPLASPADSVSSESSNEGITAN